MLHNSEQLLHEEAPPQFSFIKRMRNMDFELVKTPDSSVFCASVGFALLGVEFDVTNLLGVVTIQNPKHKICWSVPSIESDAHLVLPRAMYH